VVNSGLYVATVSSCGNHCHQLMINVESLTAAVHRQKYVTSQLTA